MNLEIDSALFIEELKAQRNAALDGMAMLKAANIAKDRKIADLKAASARQATSGADEETMTDRPPKRAGAQSAKPKGGR